MANPQISQEEFERILAIESTKKPSLFDSLLLAKRLDNQPLLNSLVELHYQKMARAKAMQELTLSMAEEDKQVNAMHRRNIMLAVMFCLIGAGYDFYIATPLSITIGFVLLGVSGWGLYEMNKVSKDCGRVTVFMKSLVKRFS